jgi:hypothetical protein
MRKNEILRQIRTLSVQNKKLVVQLEERAKRAKILDEYRELEEIKIEFEKLISAWKKCLDAQRKMTKNKEIENEVSAILSIIEEIKKRFNQEYDD